MSRPKMYDHERIVRVLCRYRGQQGGLKAAVGEIRQLLPAKSGSCKGVGYGKISSPLVSLIARQNKVEFAPGRPLVAPKRRRNAA